MERWTLLLEISLALYAISGALFIWNVAKGARIAGSAASGTAVLGLLTHSLGLALLTVGQMRAPFLDLFGSLVFFAWALMAVYLAVERGHRVSALGAFACAISCAALASALLMPRELIGALPPALRSRWSTLHIASGLVSYAGFVLAFGSSLAYALQEKLLKAKRITAFQRRLPPLDALDRFAYRMVAFAFPMLTLAVITGAIWAQSAWGSYWSWDLKETWSLITWLVYAAYLHMRVIQGRRGRWANRLLLAGFACVLITYLGVSLLHSGLHSHGR